MPLSAELKDPKTGERKYLDRDERRAFLEATQHMEARKKYYCQLLYYTGCRLSEALELRYNSFDFKRGYVTIRTLKQGSRDGKPVERYRDNELPQTYLNEIRGFYATVRGRRPHKLAASEPLWSITDRMARNYVSDVMTAAGISGRRATSRGLRHSMGVMLAMEKVPVNVIQKVLGHSSVKNTMIYLDILDDERRQLISQVW